MVLVRPFASQLNDNSPAWQTRSWALRAISQVNNLQRLITAQGNAKLALLQYFTGERSRWHTVPWNSPQKTAQRTKELRMSMLFLNLLQKVKTPSCPWERMGSWLLSRLPTLQSFGHCCSRCHRGTANTSSYQISSNTIQYEGQVLQMESITISVHNCLDTIPTDTEKSVSKQIQCETNPQQLHVLEMPAADSCKWRSGSSLQTDSHGGISHSYYHQFLTGSLSPLFLATADTTYKPHKPQQERSLHPPWPSTICLQDFSSQIRTV